MFVFNSLENGTQNSVNFTVKGDMKVGSYNGSGGTAGAEFYKAEFNSSTVHIGRVFSPAGDQRPAGDIAPSGSSDLGGATIYVGSDLFFANPHPAGTPAYTKTIDNWNSGTSTIICDGNGTDALRGRKAQTITTYSYMTGTGDTRFSLNNLVIQNECNTVSLANSRAGELFLTGDLRLEKSKFVDFDRSITFNSNGSYHTLFWDNNTCKIPTATGHTTPNALDNIILLPGARVSLDAGTHTKIIMDNLDMQSGSEIYLNNSVILTADGKTFDGIANVGPGGPGPWPFDSGLGTIYPGVIPEPGTLLLLGTGIIGLLGYLRRRRMK
jgi:hypothetical protein